MDGRKNELQSAPDHGLAYRAWFVCWIGAVSGGTKANVCRRDAFESAKRFGSAIHTYLRLVKSYPQSSHAFISMRRLGTLYLRAKQDKRAIRCYEQIILTRRYVHRHGKHVQWIHADLVHLYAKTKEHHKAAQRALLYATRYAHSPDAGRMVLVAGEQFVKAKRHGQAIKVLTRCSKHQLPSCRAAKIRALARRRLRTLQNTHR